MGSTPKGSDPPVSISGIQLYLSGTLWHIPDNVTMELPFSARHGAADRLDRGRQLQYRQALGFDIPLRYPPFKNKLKLLKKLMH